MSAYDKYGNSEEELMNELEDGFITQDEFNKAMSEIREEIRQQKEETEAEEEAEQDYYDQY